MGLFSRVYSQNSWQNTPTARKRQHLKPFKIRPHATKPIDIVLRKSAGAGGLALCSPVMMLFSRWYLFPPQQAVRFKGFNIHLLYHNRTSRMLSTGVKPLKSDRAMLGCALSLRYHLSKSTISYVPTTNLIVSFAEGPGCSSKDDILKRIPPRPSRGLVFKGLLPKTPSRIHTPR